MKRKTWRYLMIILCCCGFSAATLGLCNTADGVFYSSVAQKLAVGQGAVTLVSTITGLAMGLLGPVVLVLLRYVSIRVIATVGSFLAAASTYAMVYADRIGQYYVLGALRGIGCACISVLMITIIIGNWFTDRQGMVTGIAMSFSGVAGAILSPFLSTIILDYGYTAARTISAIIIVVLTVPGTLFALRLRPESVGLSPWVAKNKADKPSDNEDTADTEQLRFASQGFVLIVLYTVLTGAIITILPHFPKYSETIGLGATFGATLISAAMIGNIGGKFLLGYLSDHIGAMKANLLMLLINLSALIVFVFRPENKYVLLFAATAFGAMYSICIVGISLLVRKIYGNKQYGKIYSITSAISIVSTSLLISVVGFLYDLTGAYTLAFGIFLCFNLICIATLATISVIFGKTKHNLKMKTADKGV